MLKIRLSTGLCVALALFAVPASATECGEPGTPARTVPQFRSEIPGQSIWPLDSFGEVIFKPASQIPLQRDSTDYLTLTIPGSQSGHELFQDVAVLDGNDDWLFVAYNAGLQIWDLRTSPANPQRLLFRDGWQRQIREFPGFGEGDTYIDAIDVIAAPTGSNAFIALAGRSGHGISIWRFNLINGDLEQIFQSARNWYRDVELINHSNGRTYALAPSSDASNGGLHVFDVTAANGSPCFDDEVAPDVCPQYEGTVGTMVDGAYVDTVQIGSETYLVASDGSSFPTDRLRTQIWLLTDPDNPGSANLKFDGLNNNTRGVQLFEMNSRYFLGVIDYLGATNTFSRVYEATSCLDADGCTSVGSPLWSAANRAISGNFQFLTVSKSGNRTFLYYGLETTPLNGSRTEALYDITSLGTGGSNVFEITDAGADYVDPCSSQVIDYWGDYYTNNAYGIDNLLPRHGIFIGKYFYRAAIGVLDIHELVQDDPQSSILTSTGNGPFWLGDPVGFGTVPGGGCTPGAGEWCWLVEPETGNNISFAPTPANQVTGCDPSFVANQAFTFTCNGPERCDDTMVGVTAWNLDCGSVVDGVQNTAELTLLDPTVEAAASGDTAIQECQTSALSAELVGRGPANWRWEIAGAPVAGCDGSVVGAFDLSTVGAQRCSFTADEFEDIFAATFEVGDCSEWSSNTDNCGLPSFTETLSSRVGTGTVTASFRVWDPAAGPENPLALENVVIDISPIGDPAWVNAGAPVTVMVSGDEATLTAAATDTGTWSWEFEDPNGGETCTLPGVGTVNCTTEMTTGPTTQKSWASEGTYAYRVVASNCRSSVTQTATGSVTIESLGVQPNIVAFDLSGNPSSVCCGSLPFDPLKCVVGQTVSVRVDVANADPSFDFSFDPNRVTNGSADTGTFGATVTPTSTSGNSYFFDVVFTSTGVRWPATRAQSGSFEDFHELFAGATGESSTSLEIVSAGGCS
ncbi:MAG: PKD domain-containing protein [Acidobacteriota bacterium]